MRTRIKICGITRVEHAHLAGALGADAIGLVFYAPSPRAVDLEVAQRIAAAAGPFVARVGLFLDAEPDYVREVVEAVPLDLLQFHGKESPADCGGFGRPYIKAIAMGAGVPSVDHVGAYAADYPDAAGFLLDGHVTGQAGGGGAVFDWSVAPRDFDRPLILAGGLDPVSVGQAIRTVRPWGVDVSSGVESARGVKDAARIKAFIEEVQRVDSERS